MQDLANFNNDTFSRDAGRLKETCWLLLRRIFFECSVMPWYRLRRSILSRFGGKISRSVITKPGCKITFPWKLSVGEHSWLGEDAWLMNLEQITIGNNVCISQRAILCTGNHDWLAPAFDLIVKPIIVEDKVWIGANAFVGPGVTLHEGCVVTAGSVVTKDMPAWTICGGNPCVPLKPRKIRST